MLPTTRNGLDLTKVLLSVAAVALAQPVSVAFARPEKAKKVDMAVCPYSGLPPIEAFVGDNITVADIRFNLSRAGDASKFQQLLAVCNATVALPSYIEWKQAHALVVAKSAQMSAYAVSTGAKLMTAKTDEEKRQIAADGAAAAAQFTAELVPLGTDANAKKQMFQATFMGCVAP